MIRIDKVSRSDASNAETSVSTAFRDIQLLADRSDESDNKITLPIRKRTYCQDGNNSGTLSSVDELSKLGF